MNYKLNIKRSAKDSLKWNNQRGALLIGLIITMVIISVLSGAMVYIFSSSTLNPVSGKYAQQAYYNAEAGFRYLTSVYRNAATPDQGKTAILLYLTEQTLNMPEGGIAKVSMTAPSVKVTATATLNGSDLDLSTSFPDPPGFFSIGTDTPVYRYMGISNGGLKLTRISPSLPIGFTTGSIETKEQTTITSKGTYGGGSGLWNVTRKITYAWVLSGFPAGSSPVPPPLPIAPADMRVDTGAMKFEEVTAPPDPTGKALWVKSDQGGGAITEAYVVPPSSVYATNTNQNPFRIMWNSAGGYSSYDLQVKIATNGTGAVTGTLGNYLTIAWNDSLRPDTYANGLAFRAIKHASLNQYGFLGLSLMRSHIGGDTDGIVDNMVPPLTVPTAAAWKKNDSYTLGQIVLTDNYYECIQAYNAGNNNDTRPSSLTPNATYWRDITKPMIVLWRRDRNEANGDDRWLAYSLLNQDGSDYIVDRNMVVKDNHLTNRVKDWSTLLVRVVEAASLEFSTNAATTVQVDDIVEGSISGVKGKVIKKIKNTTGTHDVLLLNNLTGLFVPSDNISGLGTATFRARDNYIWAMFGDKDPHSTATATPDPDEPTIFQFSADADANPLNNLRHGNKRLTDAQSISASEVAKRIHWPEYNIEDDWGNVLTDLPSPFNVKNDYFQLVRWNNSKNTTLDSSLEVLGFDKEQNAIIRTSNPEWFRVGPYNDLTYPPEIGLAALGNTSQKTFFDDFIYRFPYIPSGGVAYVSPIQQ